ncbi:MAG TPA: phytase [Methylophaga aminisulfidivorans]|uniref:Phytase n=2 Tax=root TaxID=1 RepID=A0A7C1W4W8_9GAMM|nr:phytase [Methylophaga aminisulfidivorans]
MNTKLKNSLKPWVLLAGLGLSSACSAATLFQQDWTIKNVNIEAAQLLQTSLLAGVDRIVSYEQHGISIENSNGEPLSTLTGNFSSVDHRSLASDLLLAAVDNDRQQALLTTLNAEGQWSTPVYIPKTEYKIDGVCLYQDEAHNAFLFLVGEQGLGEQWLVANNHSTMATPLRVRGLSLPPSSEFCQVNDRSDQLFINEENVGVWAYDAHAEAELSRVPVAMIKPFGELNRGAAGISLIPGGIVVVDADKKTLHTYLQKADKWLPQAHVSLDKSHGADMVSARFKNQSLQVMIRSDDGLRSLQSKWSVQSSDDHPLIPSIPALVQTDPVPSLGDAADDPAIWVNSLNAEKSRVLGTDKQGGLGVYDLDGKQLQYLPVGRLNNVDVRTGFQFAGKTIDLAVATNRDHNSLHVFAIAPDSGEVTALGEIATKSDDIYGFCLFKSHKGDIYAIANDKDGRFFQYLLEDNKGQISGHLAREFSVSSQPEGCVADDRNERLFIGEENVAVWALEARADRPSAMQQVMPIGELLHADIEGISLYQDKHHPLLVISSQGNDSYVVLDATPPYSYQGGFRVGFNTDKGLDGASETDGLDVSSANLGGVWSAGMLVVQDGRNRMPTANQNFKYIPWSAIAEQLDLSRQK